MIEKKKIERWIGIGVIVLGAILCANAIISGPHAFALGRKAVGIMAVAGIACIIAGACQIWHSRTRDMSG